MRFNKSGMRCLPRFVPGCRTSAHTVLFAPVRPTFEPRESEIKGLQRRKRREKEIKVEEERYDRLPEK